CRTSAPARVAPASTPTASRTANGSARRAVLDIVVVGAPGRSRTCGPRVRTLMTPITLPDGQAGAALTPRPAMQRGTSAALGDFQDVLLDGSASGHGLGPTHDAAGEAVVVDDPDDCFGNLLRLSHD